MMEDVINRLKAFIEEETRSCSMDFGGITPLYVYRILQIVMMFGTDDLMNNVRILALYGDSMGILNYSMVITQSLFVVALWAHPKIPTWQVVVLGIACLLNSLAIMEKGSMFFIFISHSENFILLRWLYAPSTFIRSLFCCGIVVAGRKIEMPFISGTISLICIPCNMWIVICHCYAFL